MPTIAPASPAVARRLGRSITTASLVPPQSNIAILTPNGGNVFEVGPELLAAYNLDVTNNPQAPAAPNCRANNPCYVARCVDTMQAPRDTYEIPVAYSASVNVDGYLVSVSVSNGPPDADYTFDWGDGTTEPMQLDANGDWSGSHTYSADGTYTLAVGDDDGVVATLPIPVPST